MNDEKPHARARRRVGATDQDRGLGGGRLRLCCLPYVTRLRDMMNAATEFVQSDGAGDKGASDGTSPWLKKQTEELVRRVL